MAYFPNASISVIGSAIPTVAGLIGGSDGTNLRAFLTDTTGQLKVLVQNASAITVAGGLTNNSAAPSTNNIGVLASIASYAPKVAAQGNLVLQTQDLQGNLRTTYSLRDTDVLGAFVAHTRDVQWEVNHSLGADATNITPTITGSGTISYVTNPGAATLATTAAASSGANLVSITALSYQVVAEWFCYFTVGFPSVTGAVGSQVGVANSHQRSGIYNGSPTDGFFIGFEGASSFGITQFRNGTGQGSFTANSAVGIALSSFNGDTCSGAAGSSFTSGGSPVAIDFTKLNLFRIRGAWLGAGIVVLEVASPDGVWVTMHSFRNPNTLTQPYTATTTYLYQVDLQNTTNATNLQMVLGGGAFGTDSCIGESRITEVLSGASVVPTVRSAGWAQYLSSGYASPTTGNYGPLQIDSIGNLKTNVVSWGGTQLGAPTNFGTTPGAVTAGIVNASLFSGTTALGTPNTFGTTAPTGNALGVNAAMFVGTTAVSSAISGALDDNVKGWGGTALGTPANFGTTPGAVIAGSVNSSLFVGTTVVSASAPIPVSPTAAANSNTNPFFTSLTDGTTKVTVIASTAALKTDNSSWAGTALGAPTNFGTMPGAVIAGSVNASIAVGTTAVRSNQTTTATGAIDVNIVGSIGSTMSATKPLFTNLTDGTTAMAAAVSALGTAPTGTSVVAVNAVSLPSTAAGAALSLFQNSAVTTAVVAKAGAGNLYGALVNGGTSGNFLQFINQSSSPTLGTLAVFSIQIPASGIISIPPGSFPLNNFTTGISVGISTTYNGASAGTAASVVLFYK